MLKCRHARSTAQSRGAEAEAIALDAFVVTCRTGSPAATTRVLPDVDARTPLAPAGSLRATLAARRFSPRCPLQPLRLRFRSSREGMRSGQGAADPTALRAKTCNHG